MKDDTAVNQTTTILVDNRPVAGCLPSLCLLCGAPGNVLVSLCGSCVTDLPQEDYACPVCALPMPGGVMCAHCLKNKQHPINKTTALFNYRYPVNLIIQNIKFSADMVAANNLGQLLANHLKTKGVDLPECIIPVPQHPLRLLQRGYNQALEIARPISKILGLPLETRICKRIRHTTPQTELTVSQRKRNICNAFSLNGTNKYRHVAIVDDVMTTGSTISELAKTLSTPEKIHIQAWVCARASSQ